MAIDSEHIYHIHLCAYSVLFTFAALLVLLRLFVKIRIVRNVGADDIAIVFALVGVLR